jgi:hypothetical protein
MFWDWHSIYSLDVQHDADIRHAQYVWNLIPFSTMHFYFKNKYLNTPFSNPQTVSSQTTNKWSSSDKYKLLLNFNLKPYQHCMRVKVCKVKNDMPLLLIRTSFLLHAVSIKYVLKLCPPPQVLWGGGGKFILWETYLFWMKYGCKVKYLLILIGTLLGWNILLITLYRVYRY